MSSQARQLVQTEFRRQQLTLDKHALQLIVDLVDQRESGLETVYAIIDKLDTGVGLCSMYVSALASHRQSINCAYVAFADSHSKITGPLVQQALQKLTNSSNQVPLIQSYDAFSLPKIRFDNISQRFHSVSGQPTLHGAADVSCSGLILTLVCNSILPGIAELPGMQDRFNLYLDRLLLLYQRLRRDRTFSKPALADADANPSNSSCCQVSDLRTSIVVFTIWQRPASSHQCHADIAVKAVLQVLHKQCCCSNHSLTKDDLPS